MLAWLFAAVRAERTDAVLHGPGVTIVDASGSLSSPQPLSLLTCLGLGLRAVLGMVAALGAAGR